MKLKSHQKSMAHYLAIAFGIVVLIISATTSFGFFYRFFSGLIPADIVGAFVARVVAGIVGVILYDLATVFWLTLFLSNADTPHQRAISGVMIAVSFIGAAVASVAHVILTATSFELTGSWFVTLQWVSVGTVTVGIIAQFGAKTLYDSQSHENTVKMKEADRRDELLDAQFAQMDTLTDKVKAESGRYFDMVAPDLAAHQARLIIQDFWKKESDKYGINAPMPNALLDKLEAAQDKPQAAATPTPAQTPTQPQNDAPAPIMPPREPRPLGWHIKPKNAAAADFLAGNGQGNG